jgi:hypothetical protein
MKRQKRRRYTWQQLSPEQKAEVRKSQTQGHPSNHPTEKELETCSYRKRTDGGWSRLDPFALKDTFSIEV